MDKSLDIIDRLNRAMLGTGFYFDTLFPCNMQGDKGCVLYYSECRDRKQRTYMSDDYLPKSDLAIRCYRTTICLSKNIERFLTGDNSSITFNGWCLTDMSVFNYLKTDASAIARYARDYFKSWLNDLAQATTLEEIELQMVVSGIWN